MIAFSSGGRWAATCRLLKPPQEMPIIPIVARAPRLGGDPAQHLQAVELLLRVVLVEQHALGVARAADVDAHRRVAVAGEPRVAHRVVGRRWRRPCGTAGTRGSRAPGRCSASSGSQIRALRRMPSASGIQTCSIDRTRAGSPCACGGHRPSGRPRLGRAARGVGVERAGAEVVGPAAGTRPTASAAASTGAAVEVDAQVDVAQSRVARRRRRTAERGPALLAAGVAPGLQRAHQPLGQRLVRRRPRTRSTIARPTPGVGEHVADRDAAGAVLLGARRDDLGARPARRCRPPASTTASWRQRACSRRRDQRLQRRRRVAPRAQQRQAARAQPRVGAVLRQHGADAGLDVRHARADGEVRRGRAGAQLRRWPRSVRPARTSRAAPRRRASGTSQTSAGSQPKRVADSAVSLRPGAMHARCPSGARS